MKLLRVFGAIVTIAGMTVKTLVVELLLINMFSTPRANSECIKMKDFNHIMNILFDKRS